MISLAEIHSLSCSTPQALGTTVGYSLHRKAILLPGQKPSQLLASENLLSPNELRIAIALRIGANIFESTECRCGTFVDRLGLHGLSCIKNAGRFPRHSAINSILKQSLTRIGLPSVLEPVGLTRERRSDGLTLNLWYRDRSLVWDATVVETFAESHYIVSAAIPGSIGERTSRGAAAPRG